ncbi:unnamed protein product, partial [Didymodactylos carnosus]
MSEARSASKSRAFYYDNTHVYPIAQIIGNMLPMNVLLSNFLKEWLTMTDNKQNYMGYLHVRDLSKDDIQSNFYQHIIKLFPHYKAILQYSNNYYGDVYKNVFRGLRPGFCLVNDTNLARKALDSSLDIAYLPTNIVSILELKKKLKNNDVGQLLHYLQIVLDYSPKRKYMIGAITDFASIRFAKVVRISDSEYKYEISLQNVLGNDVEFLLKYLTTFFSMKHEDFGFIKLNPLPHDLVIHNKVLGVGANSVVVTCFMENDDKKNLYALKITTDNVHNEYEIYKKLKYENFVCETINDYGLLFKHLPGDIISSKNLLLLANI